MKKILTVAGILNFLAIIFLGYNLSNHALLFGFLISSGIVYIYIANNEDFLYKRNLLIVLGLINLFTNFISGLLVFISLDKKFESSKHKITTKTIKQKLDPETRKIDLLLKLGVGMVIVSGLIFATTSWNEVSGTFKFMFLIFMSFIFYGLYFFSKLKLKIKLSAFVYFNLANLFLIFSFISIGYFSLIGPWFSINGLGANIFWASLSVFITLIALLINSVYPNKPLKSTAYSFIVIALYLVLNYFEIGLEIIFLILTSISSIIILFKKEKTDTLKKFANAMVYVISFLFVFIYSDFSNSYVIIALALILIYNLFSFVDKYEGNIVNYVASGLLVAIPLTFLNGLIDNYQMASVVIGGVLSSIYIISLGLFSKPNKKPFLNTVGSLSNFAILITMVNLITSNDVVEALILSLMLGATFGVYIFLNKYDKVNLVENKLRIVKLSAFLYTLLSLINHYVFKVNNLWIIIITTLLIFALYMFSKTNKKENFIAFIILLAFSSIICISSSDKLILLSLLSLSTLPFLITHLKKLQPEDIQLPFLIYLLLMIYMVIVGSSAFNLDTALLSLIVIIIYALITVMLRKKKPLTYVAHFGLLLPVHSLLYYIEMNYQLKLILQMSFHLYLIFIFCHFILKNNKLKNVYAATLISIVTLPVIFSGNLLVGLYLGLVSLLLIVIGYSKKEYGYLFIVGIVMTIINIMYQLSVLAINIPLWAYLLISGLGLIIFVTYKELQKSKK